MILRFSSLLGMYTFDAHHQHHKGNKWRHVDFEALFHNVDYSLRRTLPQIMQADLNTELNYRTSIYIKSMSLVLYSNTTAGNNTESERVFLKDQQKIRYDYQGQATGINTTSKEISAGFVKYELKPWYNFVVNQMYRVDGRLCEPPYTAFFYF